MEKFLNFLIAKLLNSDFIEKLYVGIVLGILILGLFMFTIKSKAKTVIGKHVFITGATSGIGKALAIACVRQGAHVTIMARRRAVLMEMVEMLDGMRINEAQLVQHVTGNVDDFEYVEARFDIIEATIAPVDMVINCAGVAVCGELDVMDINNVNLMLSTNLLGACNIAKIAMTRFKFRNNGILVLIGSEASFIGLYGMAAYCSSKFGVRGLAEALAMEAKPYNISVTFVAPPDTDTPGYQAENESKPEITRIISAAGGLYQPNTIADGILKDALNKKFFCTFGFSGWLLKKLCKGTAPMSSVFQVMFETFYLGLVRLIGGFYQLYFEYVIFYYQHNE